MRDARAIRDQLGLPDLKAFAGDLVVVPRWQVILSLLVPWICFAIYLLAAMLNWWPIAVLAVVLLSFFTYGSISHDLVHRNLGLSRRANDVLLCVTELLALRSGHAYQAAHWHHHARFPSDDDVEGAAASMTFLRSIAEGFILQPKLYFWALRQPNGRKAFIWFEGIVCVLLIITSIAVTPWTMVPVIYVGLVIAGSWIIPLVTSYIPHQVLPEASAKKSESSHAGALPDAALRQTKLFRGWALSVIAIEHLYHLEHHLYPQVPHHHWAELAHRLDPYFEQAGLKAIRLGRRQERRHRANSTQ